jgi:hypothetical protein
LTDRDEVSFRARSEQISWRQVGEEVVILDLETSQYLTLNETGAFLWELLCQKAMTVEDLVAALLGEFDAAEDDAHHDVQEFLDSCRDLHLINPE